MPGPPPKPPDQRRRRNPVAVVARRLPAGGYAGPIPAYPFGHAPVAGEADLWAELWRTPQAAAWADLGWTRIVARYCRWLAASEVGDPTDVSAAVLGELRQLEDRLGLTPMAMRRLGWEVGDQPDPATPTGAVSAGRRRTHDDLAVDPDAVARPRAGR